METNGGSKEACKFGNSVYSVHFEEGSTVAERAAQLQAEEAVKGPVRLQDLPAFGQAYESDGNQAHQIRRQPNRSSSGLAMGSLEALNQRLGVAVGRNGNQASMMTG